jgi:cellulose synthase/poly-beta-1,6-N-acetylglucosamine synthase-like glycosyltransferase
MILPVYKPSSVIMTKLSQIALLLLCASLLWTMFLIDDVRRRLHPPSTLRQVCLLYHNIPAMFLLGTTLVAESAEDTALVWFVALIIFRYWRTLVNIWFWFQYELAVATPGFNITPRDCTVIVPTVGPGDTESYNEMLASILVNQPARLAFSTNTTSAAKQVEAALPAVLTQIRAGTTAYQKQHGLPALEPSTEILVLNAQVSDKRRQVVHGFSNVKTKILVMADDTAVWNPRFLQATLPAFQSEKVGFVGSQKWVKRVRHPRDKTASLFVSLWKQYIAGFWNTMGALYLIRHNFEIRATNAADGGVFCVSGRTSLIRTDIVLNTRFTNAFLNEYVFCWGPMMVDDDNFITRWVINHGFDVKMQSSEEATMTTTLGTLPLKFRNQCKRWSRTTFRQNPIALFVDRTVWWKWPLTCWTTLFPWMYNAALIWDTLAVYTLAKTKLYEQSSCRATMLCSLVMFIWLTKLVKTIPWFYAYPRDFLLYFIIPAYPLFVYWHSLLKIYTALTFWDLSWSGRELKQ